jgi:small subunit ribosomal protein S3
VGQKVNPVGFRIGIIRDWESKWYANDRDFGNLLMEDVKIR